MQYIQRTRGTWRPWQLGKSIIYEHLARFRERCTRVTHGQTQLFSFGLRNLASPYGNIGSTYVAPDVHAHLHTRSCESLGGLFTSTRSSASDGSKWCCGTDATPNYTQEYRRHFASLLLLLSAEAFRRVHGCTSRYTSAAKSGDVVYSAALIACRIQSQLVARKILRSNVKLRRPHLGVG